MYGVGVQECFKCVKDKARLSKENVKSVMKNIPVDFFSLAA